MSSLGVELVGRAMAEDAIAYHTADEKPTAELVANNNAIRHLAQPKVYYYYRTFSFLSGTSIHLTCGVFTFSLCMYMCGPRPSLIVRTSKHIYNLTQCHACCVLHVRI